MTGDFLTEAKEQAESNRGPNKPLAERYKGMTSDELKVFRDEQARQMEEIEASYFCLIAQHSQRSIVSYSRGDSEIPSQASS